MSQDLRKIFATNVKKLRTKKGLKREELSLILDCDNSYVSKLEREKVNITLDKIQKIAEIFNVMASDLLKS